MRALSLRCPFPWLVVNGHKPWENRRQNTRMRGWVLVHASRQYSGEDLRMARDMLARLKAPELPLVEMLEHLVSGLMPRDPCPWLMAGGIVGAMRIDAVAPPIRAGYGDPLPDWRLYGSFGYEIGAVERLPFVPCSGKLGFWRVPFALARELEAKTPIWLWDELQKNA